MYVTFIIIQIRPHNVFTIYPYIHSCVPIYSLSILIN